MPRLSSLLHELALLSLLGGLTFGLGGCGICGRQLVFDVTVRDGAGKAIEGATVSVDCLDLDGSRHRPEDGSDTTTDASGAASFRVTAPNRDCPEDPDKIASYVRSCDVTAAANGFSQRTVSLTGDEMDGRAPDQDFEDGNHIPLALTLTP